MLAINPVLRISDAVPTITSTGALYLAVNTDSSITVDTTTLEAIELSKWFESHKTTLDMPKYDSRVSQMPFEEVEKRLLSSKEESLVFECTFTIISVNMRARSYAACLTAGCRKKVELIDGSYVCSKCDKKSDTCQRQVILTVS